MISCGFCGFKNGSTRVSVLINTDGAVVGLGEGGEKLIRLESAKLGTFIAQE